MINEFGERISDKEATTIKTRIGNLSEESIEELFADLGFRIHRTIKGEKVAPDRAIPLDKVRDIQSESGDTGIVESLIFESPIDELLNSLNRLENEES